MLAKTPKAERKPRKKRAPAKPKVPAFTVDIAGLDEGSFADVLDLMLAEIEEVATVPMNPVKVADAVYLALEQGMTLVARDRSGKAIGFLALVRTSYWYGDADKLQDMAFYVLPKHRRSRVGNTLLAGGRAIADAAGLPLFITIANPTRKRQRPVPRLVDTKIGYLPAGYTLRMA